MRISARCDYACRAMLELSLHWPSKKPLRTQEISEKQDIPERFLVQILLQLKRDGLVVSSRGKGGGYNLATPPDDIPLGLVMRKMGGRLLPVAESAGKKRSVFDDVWHDAEKAMAKLLDTVTFADIRDRANGEGNVIFYQI